MGRKQEPPRLDFLEGDDSGIYYIFFSGPKWSPAKNKMVTRTQRESTGETDYKEAVRYFNGWLQGSSEKEKNKDRATVGECERFYVQEVLEMGALCGKDHAARLGRFCEFVGREKFMGDLQMTDVNAFIRKRRKDPGVREGTTVMDSTIWGEVSVFRTCRNYNRDHNKLKGEDLFKLKIPEFRVDASKTRFFTDDQVKTLMEMAQAFSRGLTNRYTPMFRWLAIAIGTGRRTNAIETLRWSQIDRSQEFWVIDFDTPGRPITKKQRGSITACIWLQPLLEEFYAQRLSDDGYVLDTACGRSSSFKIICTRAGLPWGHAHLTRHTFATRMVLDGANPFEVAEAMCCTVKTATKHYFHGSRAATKKVIDKHALPASVGKVKLGAPKPIIPAHRMEKRYPRRKPGEPIVPRKAGRKMGSIAQ